MGNQWAPLQAGSLELLVLDEADVMLDREFKEEVQKIFQFLPHEIQCACFSATLPPPVLELTRCFLRDPDPVRILVKAEQLTLAGIQQFFVDVGPGRPDQDHKLAVLNDLYETLTISQCIIYVNTRRTADWLYQKLNAQDYCCSVMHAELEQAERNRVMRAFRSGSSRVLISTDLLARGIDVYQVSLVLNYDLPLSIENYIHRIGRSGRFGRRGVGISFVASGIHQDVAKIRDLEAYYATEIKPLPADFEDFL